ncbi:hypothetical protein PTW35_05645 [Photobacterium sp. DA100]|nr:hypothetical protein [Photobacterium sp. DA100]WEM43279.1 hypothetical protein PTW35_05645 [Photobacterium sp. DA100]
MTKRNGEKEYKEGKAIELIELLVALSFGGIELHPQPIDIGLLLTELLLA